MNIKEAKEQITNAIKVYFTKDKFGKYVIPIERQRPVFLMGAPGIGKTAIMEQIAEELGVGLVSYSMTHHTRQSALGLPYIQEKEYGGKKYSVSEYTMSEIIASVYDMMESTGIKEGILFLDEINCVSETLAPSMLQFLQYKIFGKHKVPDGWIVVTAGNPPEYNNSVREFDIVTWDRVKRIDVEPNFDVWKEYAYKKGIHPAITTYLETKKEHFYKIETTVDGKQFVTARGWSDLSDMIKLYEQHGIPVNIDLICQYVQNPGIAKLFEVYYNLFNKYKSDYQVEKILDGKATKDIKSRAENAEFDEGLSLVGLMLDTVTGYIRDSVNMELSLEELLNSLKNIRIEITTTKNDISTAIENQCNLLNQRIEQGKISSTLSSDQEYAMRDTDRRLHEVLGVVKAGAFENSNMAFGAIKQEYDGYKKELDKKVNAVKKKLTNMFKFCDEVFEDDQLMVILTTELTINYYSSQFISNHGSNEFFAIIDRFRLNDCREKISRKIKKLKLEE